MVGGVMELDLHGMNTYQAQIAIDAALRRCGGGVYRLRLIHGYRGGTAIRDMLWTSMPASICPSGQTAPTPAARQPLLLTADGVDSSRKSMTDPSVLPILNGAMPGRMCCIWERWCSA